MDDFERQLKAMQADIRTIRAGGTLRGQPVVSELRIGDAILTTETEDGIVYLVARNALSGAVGERVMRLP